MDPISMLISALSIADIKSVLELIRNGAEAWTSVQDAFKKAPVVSTSQNPIQEGAVSKVTPDWKTLIDEADYHNAQRFLIKLYGALNPEQYPRGTKALPLQVLCHTRKADLSQKDGPTNHFGLWRPVRELFRTIPMEAVPWGDSFWKERWCEEGVVDFHGKQLRLGPTGREKGCGAETLGRVVLERAAMVAIDFSNFRGSEIKIGIGHYRFFFRSQGTGNSGLFSWLPQNEAEGKQFQILYTLPSNFSIPQNWTGRLYAAIIEDSVFWGMELEGKEYWAWGRPLWPEPHRAPERERVPLTLEVHEGSATITRVEAHSLDSKR